MAPEKALDDDVGAKTTSAKQFLTCIPQPRRAVGKNHMLTHILLCFAYNAASSPVIAFIWSPPPALIKTRNEGGAPDTCMPFGAGYGCRVFYSWAGSQTPDLTVGARGSIDLARSSLTCHNFCWWWKAVLLCDTHSLHNIEPVSYPSFNPNGFMGLRMHRKK